LTDSGSLQIRFAASGALIRLLSGTFQHTCSLRSPLLGGHGATLLLLWCDPALVATLLGASRKRQRPANAYWIDAQIRHAIASPGFTLVCTRLSAGQLRCRWNEPATESVNPGRGGVRNGPDWGRTFTRWPVLKQIGRSAELAQLVLTVACARPNRITANPMTCTLRRMRGRF